MPDGIDKSWKEKVLSYYRGQYRTFGDKAQRKYPNEELCRFIGSNLGQVQHERRFEIRVLELGCGSGGNLWMLVSEGFNSYGLDVCSDSLVLCRQHLAERGLPPAQLFAGNLIELPVKPESFDIIVDIFTMHHIPFSRHAAAYHDISRLLKPGGLFFSFHPSANSDAFKHAEESRVDPYTLTEIQREQSPFRGNPCFCFLREEIARTMLKDAGLAVVQCEKVGRTYRDGKEYFENLVIVAKKE